jgi:hypothetical protein
MGRDWPLMPVIREQSDLAIRGCRYADLPLSIAVCSSGTLVAMDLLPSPGSAEAQQGRNNDRRQVNHIDHDCKWNSSDCLRLEFRIEIGRIGV